MCYWISPPSGWMHIQSMTSEFMTQCIYFPTHNFNQIKTVKSSRSSELIHVDAAAALIGNKRHILNPWNPPFLSIASFIFMWSKRLTDQGPKEALRYLHFQQWVVQLWLFAHQLETWVTLPSLRNNICLYGAICSLCTSGNTEAWGNIYHGSVLCCSRASQRLIYTDNHQHAVILEEM